MVAACVEIWQKANLVQGSHAMCGCLAGEVKGAANDIDFGSRQMTTIVLLDAVHSDKRLQLGTPEKGLHPHDTYPRYHNYNDDDHNDTER